MDLNRIKEKMTGTILQFAIPSIIAMVLTSLVTMVDGFFIGNYVGKEGLAAVNLGLPLFFLYIGIGLMIGVGGIAIAGMALGDQDLKTCHNVFNQTIVTTVLASVLVSVLVFLLFNPLMHFLNADDQLTIFFTQYYTIMLFAYPVMVINLVMGMFVRGEGNPQFYMKMNLLSVVLNIILDYIFTRWIGLGMKGIAIASLIAVSLSLICLLTYHATKSKAYRIGKFQFSGKVLRNTLLNGSSEFIGDMSQSISMFAYNYIIMKFVGVNGVAAFTIVGYTASIFGMIIIGIGQGASPLISFTYGAAEPKVSRKICKRANQFALIAGIVTIGFMLLMGNWYSHAFVKNSEVSALVYQGIWIFVFSFLFSGVNTITSFYFTSIGKAFESAVISSSRGLVLLLIFIFTLPRIWGMTGIWLVAPLTEALTLLLCVWFLYKDTRSQETYKSMQMS